MDDQEEKEPEMTFWGPEGGKMPEADELMAHSAPFWLTGLFTDSRAVFKHDLEEGSLAKALVRVAGATIFAGIVMVLILMALLSFIGTVMGADLLALANSIQDSFAPSIMFLALYLFIALPLLSVISFLIMNAIIYVLAKMFGGSGSFGKQASAFSLIFMLYVVMALSFGLVIVPVLAFSVYLQPLLLCFGILYFLFELFLFLFFLYLSTFAISVSHKIDVLRSLSVVILHLVASFVIYLGFSFLFAKLFILPKD
ncbi:MAG: hypothetical protein V1909_01925 [Candidatus Micrarchaeota archaeon]